MSYGNLTPFRQMSILNRRTRWFVGIADSQNTKTDGLVLTGQTPLRAKEERC